MKKKEIQNLMTQAEDAYLEGNCLSAGQLIDQIYGSLCRRKNNSIARRLKILDTLFEKTCVRDNPK